MADRSRPSRVPRPCVAHADQMGASRGFRATGTPPQYVPAMEEKGAINFKEGVILSMKHKSTVYRQTPPPPPPPIFKLEWQERGEGGGRENVVTQFSTRGATPNSKWRFSSLNAHVLWCFYGGGGVLNAHVLRCFYGGGGVLKRTCAMVLLRRGGPECTCATVLLRGVNGGQREQLVDKRCWEGHQLTKTPPLVKDCSCAYLYIAARPRQYFRQ